MSAIESDLRPQHPSRLAQLDWFAILKFLITLIIGGFVAYGSAMVQQAHRDGRIATMEVQIRTNTEQLVPRVEHEAHWKALDLRLVEMHSDLRELRETNTKILIELTRTRGKE